MDDYLTDTDRWFLVCSEKEEQELLYSQVQNPESWEVIEGGIDNG